MNYLTLRQTKLELERKRQKLEFIRTQIPLEAGGADNANTLKDLIIDCSKLEIRYKRSEDVLLSNLSPDEISFIQKEIDIWVESQLNPQQIAA